MVVWAVLIHHLYLRGLDSAATAVSSRLLDGTKIITLYSYKREFPDKNQKSLSKLVEKHLHTFRVKQF